MTTRSKKPIFQIRNSYRGKRGFLVLGFGPGLSRGVRVFCETRETAEHIRSKLRANPRYEVTLADFRVGAVKYPMHEKLKALGPARGTVQSFIDWLYDEEGWWVCEQAEFERGEDEHLVPIRESRETIMAKFFGIDLDVLEAEKQAMLDRQRELNARSES